MRFKNLITASIFVCFLCLCDDIASYPIQNNARPIDPVIQVAGHKNTIKSGPFKGTISKSLDPNEKTCYEVCKKCAHFFAMYDLLILFYF